MGELGMGNELAQGIITQQSIAEHLVSSQPPTISHRERLVLRHGGLRIAHKHTHTHARARAYPYAKMEFSEGRRDKELNLQARQRQDQGV